MNESYKAKLKVNQKPVAMNRFVEEFLARTMAGAVASLKGADSIRSLIIHHQKGNIEVTVNGTEIPLTPFPNDIISSTLVGMVSALRDVEDIDSIDLSIDVE